MAAARAVNLTTGAITPPIKRRYDGKGTRYHGK